MYTPFGMYGQNPHYTLAETPYARMTGQFTPMSEERFPGTASYLQPMFVDMNPYYGNTGIPAYPSFIGGFAMMNPQIPLAQPGYTNYPPPQCYPQQQFSMMPQQQFSIMQTVQQGYAFQGIIAAPDINNQFAQFGYWLGQIFGSLISNLISVFK